MADDIISYFPNHLIYVEPFVGGGGVYWKKEPSKADIINDLDKDLIEGYEMIKKTPLSGFPQNLDTVDKLQKFMNTTHNKIQDKLTEKIIMACNGFSGTPIIKGGKVYGKWNPYKKTIIIDKYQDRLKDTIILNEDYKKIINDYDTDVTLFYLDPPYEDSKTLYKHSSMDYVEMADILKNIKGKFILSINGSPYIRKVFKGFKIKEIELKSFASGSIGSKPRIELLIMNF
jgi:DNA adenine methylase